MQDLTVKQVIVAAKKLNLFVTENSNALHAAKNLREANTRITQLEEIIDDLRSQLAWGKNLLSTRAPLKPAIRHFDQ